MIKESLNMAGQSNPDTGGTINHQSTVQNNLNSTNVPSHAIIPTANTSLSPANDDINSAVSVACLSVEAEVERRNLYGLPQPPSSTSEANTTTAEEHVFAVPSTSVSNRTFSSTVNSKSHRPHSNHHQSFNHVRNHHNHHDQHYHHHQHSQYAHHHQQHQQHQNHYNPAHHSVTNGFTNTPVTYHSYSKHSDTNHSYSVQGSSRHRTLSERSASSSDSGLSSHHMRNSFSDSHLDRSIKKETSMGDFDENQGDHSARQNSSRNDPNDITSTPLTDEEYSTLESSFLSLQGEGKLNSTSSSSIQTMLNTPQVSFANANSHTHTIDSHAGLTAHPTWDNGLGQYKVETLHSDENSLANATQIVSADMGNMMARGDTLDRIPIFVNPNDLNQTGNHATEGHQEQRTVAGSDSQHQSQIKLIDNSTVQQQVIMDGGPTVQVVVNTPLPQIELIQGSVPEGDNNTMISSWGNLMQEKLLGDQLGVGYQSDQQLSTANIVQQVPGPTGANPSMDSYPGEYGFTVIFHRLSDNIKNKSWDFSERLKKLFIDMNKPVQAMFKVGPNPPEGLFIRALPIYAVAGHIQQPVTRCPNHASLEDSSNRGFNEEFRHHLIRVNHDNAIYDTDQSSQRLSVLVPVERPQPGGQTFDFSLKFMCLGSDVGGINRRPLKVIFTLEDHQNGDIIVLGRYTVDVRICSCPKRDKQQEEKKFTGKEQHAKHVADGLARTNSSIPLSRTNSSLVLTSNVSSVGGGKDAAACSKKRKLDKDSVEEMILVPVAKSDYQKFNEFAEGAMIARNIAKATEIKIQRRSLLHRHNPNIFKTSVKTKEEKTD